MAVGNGGPAALAALGPAAQARHLGRGAGLIDEDELLGIELRLGLEPGLAAGGNVRPLLLGGVGGFFLKLMPRRSKKYHTVAGQADTARCSARRPAISAKLMSGRSLTNARMKASWASSFDPPRLPLLARRNLTRLAIASKPSHRRRNPDAKTSRCLARRKPA